MSDESKDQLNAQSQAGEGEAESPKTFDESFEAGWKKYEEEQTLAAPKPAEKPAEKGGGEKTPYKVLKVGGKEVPVYSKQELAEKIAEMYGEEDKMVDLGQLSQDYTRKRQADAADRKKWEDNFQTKADELNAMGRRYSEIMAKLRNQGIEVDERGEPVVRRGTQPPPADKTESPKSGSVPEELTEVYKRYNLDPEFAQDHEKALIQDVYETRRVVNQMQSALKASTDALNFFQVREVVQEMARVIDDERKTSPFEDILDDNGKSLTLQEFQSTITTKAQAEVSSGKKLDLDRLTRETIREIATKQAKAKESVSLSDEMSPEDFAKKYPKLASKLGKAAGADALDKHTEKESKVPPTLDRRTKEVDLKRQPASDKGPRGMEASLEAAFSDPDILKSIQGN